MRFHLHIYFTHVKCSTFSLQKGTSYTSAKIARDLIWRSKQLSTYLTVTVYLESAWTSGHEPHSSSPPGRKPPLWQIPVGLSCGPLNRNSLLPVHHDITSALDKGSTVALVMLDQSAAFDVIDHDILLQRPEFAFSISGRALKWFGSYLQDRSLCGQRCLQNSSCGLRSTPRLGTGSAPIYYVH